MLKALLYKAFMYPLRIWGNSLGQMDQLPPNKMPQHRAGAS